MKKDTGRGVPTDPNLLTAPSVLSPDSLAVADLSSRESSNGSSATEGGECGDCPACKINDYLETHGEVVTEIVEIGEGVWLGPDQASFDADAFDFPFSLANGIAVVAIEHDSEEALMWALEQQFMARLYGGL